LSPANIVIDYHNYQPLLREALGIHSLYSRRLFLDVIFIYNLLNDLIDDSQLLGLLNLAVPTFNSRNRPTFYLSKHRTLYGYFTPIDRLLASCNNIPIVDLFYSSVAEFRDSVLKY